MSVRRFLRLSLIAAFLVPLLVFGLVLRSILGGHTREDVRMLPQPTLRALAARPAPA